MDRKTNVVGRGHFHNAGFGMADGNNRESGGKVGTKFSRKTVSVVDRIALVQGHEGEAPIAFAEFNNEIVFWKVAVLYDPGPEPWAAGVGVGAVKVEFEEWSSWFVVRGSLLNYGFEEVDEQGEFWFAEDGAGVGELYWGRGSGVEGRGR